MQVKRYKLAVMAVAGVATLLAIVWLRFGERPLSHRAAGEQELAFGDLGRALPPHAAGTQNSASSDARAPGGRKQEREPLQDAFGLVSAWRAQAPDDELLELYEAIMVPPQPGMYKSRHDADLNKLMNQLCDRETDPVRLSRFFIAIMQDETLDVVLRDYAIQHLRMACRSLLGEEKADADRAAASEAACSALIEMVEAQPCCLAGTSLLALAEIAENTQAVETGQVARMALARAGDVQTHQGIRLTALLVCAQLQNTDAIPVALNILDTSDQLSLRLAAISALGALGDRDILMQMEQMRSKLDENEKNALDAAMRKISGRTT